MLITGAGSIARFDVAAPASHASNAPPTTTIVAVRFGFIISNCGVSDRSTTTFRVCYYSSCTLYRLVQKSIRFLRSESSSSSPPDTLRRGFPEKFSPISTAVR
jgi:hypothetical protein